MKKNNRLQVTSYRFLITLVFIFAYFLTVAYCLVPTVHAQSNVSLIDQYAFGNLISLGSGVSYIVPVAVTFFFIGVTFYLVVAGIKFIVSEGDKTSVSEAKKTITHTLLAIILFILLFLVVAYIPRFFNLGFNIITP